MAELDTTEDTDVASPNASAADTGGALPVAQAPTPVVSAMPGWGNPLSSNIQKEQEALRAANDKLLAALDARGKTNLFSVAGALLSPGRTGGAWEGLGGAAAELGRQQAEQEKNAPSIAAMRAQIAQQRVGLAKQTEVSKLADQLYTTDDKGNFKINQDVLHRMYAIDPASANQAITGLKNMQALTAPKTMKLGETERILTETAPGQWKETVAGGVKVPEAIKTLRVKAGLPETGPLTPEQNTALQNYSVYAELGEPGRMAYQQLGLSPTQTLTPEQRNQVFKVAGEYRRTGAPVTNVTTKTEGAYGTELGKAAAAADVASIETARAAPGAIEQAQTIQRLLDTGKIITGAGAEFRLPVAKALYTAGLTKGEGVENTQSLVTALANTTLSAIKSSGLGTGQGFTDKDLRFLQEAKSGNISWTEENLRRLAKLTELSGRYAINAGNSQIERMKKSGKFGLEYSTYGQAIEAPKYYTPPKDKIYYRNIDDSNYSSVPPGEYFIDKEGNVRYKMTK